MLAVTLTGVATELPLAGLEMVIIPFEVEARAHEAHSKSAGKMDFTADHLGRNLSCEMVERCIDACSSLFSYVGRTPDCVVSRSQSERKKRTARKASDLRYSACFHMLNLGFDFRE